MVLTWLREGFFVDPCCCSCAHERMKAVTLDEVACQRLKAWKTSGKESFSQVIKRLVPEPGTPGAFLSFAETNGTGNPLGNELLEESVESRMAAKSDPWIS